MEKTASTPIQLFRGMTADELAALRAAHCIRVQRYDKNALCLVSWDNLSTFVPLG